MPRVTITIPDKNSQPYRFQLDRQVVTLGRGSENDIAIDSGSVSVHHAEMRRIEGGYELADMGSTNGIKLDGVRHNVIPLRSGMTAKIGDVSFDFVLSEEEREALAREKPQLNSPIYQDEPTIIKERKERPVAQKAPQPTYSANDGIGFGSVLFFIILAVAAFTAGLSIRHKKETGNSLLSELQERFATRRTIILQAPRPDPGATAPVEPAPTDK